MSNRKPERKKVEEGYKRIEIPMTPMIDVVFQLLIFFILTLKIIGPEGEFGINLPVAGGIGIGVPQATRDISVRLSANKDGSLAGVFLANRALGSQSPQCFQKLNAEIAALVGAAGGHADDFEVEIDADYQLNYENVIKTVSACRGKWSGTEIINYVTKIKFAPARAPGRGEDE